MLSSMQELIVSIPTLPVVVLVLGQTTIAALGKLRLG